MLSPRQQKWFQSLRDNLAKDTGRTLEEWVDVAKTCPESGHRARLKWFKEEHGLAQNRASLVLMEADGKAGWNDSEALLNALWKRLEDRALYERLCETITAFGDVTVGPRKSFVGFSRTFQFAAVRPVKDGVRLGLAVAPELDARLEPAKKNEGWSERLSASCLIEDIDAGLIALLKASWERS